MASTLKDWHNKSVLVVTSDGRIIVGVFAGHDQLQNVVLQEANERVYSSDANVELVPLGLYIVRGDNVCIIGEYKDKAGYENVQVSEPLPPIHQQQLI